MSLNLSGNIRSCRKERKLTQEQLAEALNVTAGAVYKWEAGLSVPELDLLVEMADFFGVSVDALLGYSIRDNRLAAIGERINEYCQTGNISALSEAEKALKKFPNSLKVVYGCAQVFHIFGLEQHRNDLLARALDLYEQALWLVTQDTGPEISEFMIHNQIGTIHISMGEPEKGVDILKKHNSGGSLSGDIGLTFSMLLRRPEEAEPYLSESLINSAITLLKTVVGYAFLYSSRQDHTAEREIAEWGRVFLQRIRTADSEDYLSKMDAVLMTLLAHAELRCGSEKQARLLLGEAAAISRRFDASPDFSISSFRFAKGVKDWNVHDMFGRTVKESLDYIIGQFADPLLASLWQDALNGTPCIIE